MVLSQQHSVVLTARIQTGDLILAKDGNKSKIWIRNECVRGALAVTGSKVEGVIRFCLERKMNTMMPAIAWLFGCSYLSVDLQPFLHVFNMAGIHQWGLRC